MFAYIKGTVTEIGTDEIIVETGGIGFSVFCELSIMFPYMLYLHPHRILPD